MSFNLDGSPTTFDDNIKSFTTAGSFFIPAGPVEQGILHVNKLSAPRFSSVFKGTFIARMTPQNKGSFNRFINNKIIPSWNKQVPGGKFPSGALRGGAAALNAYDEKE